MHKGFPTHCSVLLAGPPGVGKFEFVLGQIEGVLRGNERAVLVTLDTHPAEVSRRALALDLDLKRYEGTSFMFVDCYSPSAEEHPEPASEKKRIIVSSFSNLEGIGMAIGKAATELGTPARVFVYTVSTLYLHNSTQAIAKFFQIVTSRVKTNVGSILYAVHEGVHDSLTMNLLRSLTDGVLEMRFDDRMQREIRVHHMRGYHVDSSWYAFGFGPGLQEVVV